MVRGVAAVLATIIVMAVVLLAFPPVIEGIGEEVKTFDSIDDGSMDGTSWINQTYDAIFVWVPLVAIGGMVLAAVVYYWRKEQARGVRRI